MKLNIYMMKKLMYELLLLAIIVIVAVGCKKQNINKSLVSSESISETYSLKSGGATTSQNGILNFSDWETAIQFMNGVVQTNENHVTDFYNNHSGFTDDELDSIQDATNWKYNQAYIDIEQQYGVKTLLTFVEDKLSQENLSLNDSIYWNKYLVEDDFGSILNSDAIVSVGDSIYKFLQNMSVIASTFNSLDLVKSINDDNIESYLDNNQLKIHGYTQKNGSKCRSNRQKYGISFYQYGGKIRIVKGWLVVRNLPTGSGGFSIRYVRAKTKTEVYRRKRWRRWRTNISAATIGTIYRNSQPWFCQGAEEGCNTSRQRWNHKVKSTYKNHSVWQLSIFRAKAGEVKSIHQAPGSYFEIWLD